MVVDVASTRIVEKIDKHLQLYTSGTNKNIAVVT